MTCSSIKQKRTLLSISHAHILKVTDTLQTSQETVLEDKYGVVQSTRRKVRSSLKKNSHSRQTCKNRCRLSHPFWIHILHQPFLSSLTKNFLGYQPHQKDNVQYLHLLDKHLVNQYLNCIVVKTVHMQHAETNLILREDIHQFNKIFITLQGVTVSIERWNYSLKFCLRNWHIYFTFYFCRVHAFALVFKHPSL